MLRLRFNQIMLTVALSSLCVVAQTQQPVVEPVKAETPSNGVITGRVVSDSGQPLANAVVQARPTGNPNAGQSAATDREGTFQVTGLEQGVSYYLYASMPAYTTPPREPGPTATPAAYRAGDSVTLTLIKGAAITGTVMTATGEPVVGIRVRVERVMRAANGRRLPNSWSVGEKQTDDRGIYRVYGVPAGTYVVMAGGASQSYSSSFIDPYDTDVPTYAPSSTRDTAAEITVRAGEEVAGIDIRYRGEQGRTISGIVSGGSAGFSVTLTAVGTLVPWNDSTYPQINDRSFSFVGVADGEYELLAHTYSETRDNGLSEVKRIRVRGADVTGIELTTRLLGSVAGRLTLEDPKIPECTGQSPASFDAMTVGAWHNDTEAAKEVPQSVWAMGQPVKPDAQGNFVVRNLAPGEYYFVARVPAKTWYVRSIQFAPATAKKPVDATRVWTNVKFGDRLTGLAITLTQGGASFAGQLALAEGEKVPPRTFVYLAPVERERAENSLSYFGTPVTSEGKIAINNIAPGRYWIYAQTISEDAPMPLARIRFPHETETRAQIRREAEAAKTEIEFKPCQSVVDFKLPLNPQQ